MYQLWMKNASKNVRVVGWRKEDDEREVSKSENKMSRKSGKERNFSMSIDIKGKNEEHLGGSLTNEETTLGKLSRLEFAHEKMI